MWAAKLMRRAYMGDGRVDLYENEGEQWAYFWNIDGDIWCYSPTRKERVTGKEFQFNLSSAPEDLRNWILLGLSAEEGRVIVPLPNHEKYPPEGAEGVLLELDGESWEFVYEVQKTRPNEIHMYLPTVLLKQIKPIKGL